MLELIGIRKTFNKGTVNAKLALDGISFTINDGDFITVIGSNGSGKSTMLNAIAGVVPVDEGTILFDGEDITDKPDFVRASKIGRVFQDPMTGTNPNMQICENMALALRRGKKRGLRWGITNKEKEEYRNILSSLGLGLEDRLTTKAGLLSGGQRQALTLLMATLVEPKLLLLDEHTAALDPKTAAKVLEMTDSIISKSNLTTLMVTHNMRDAIDHGNRLIMMDQGKIVVDVSGEAKKNLTVAELLELFAKAGGGDDIPDSMLLSRQQ